ncbi:hypothetical protein NE865_03297 [Phthorimaea operculella]|nr:hypothetical protein NE865_03297 [Phthorimaea operculella]
MPTLWAGDGSKNIRFNHKLDCSDPERTRGSLGRLPGRFHDRKSEQNGATKACSNDLNLLTFLGWTINFPKSVLEPQKAIQFLGVMWNPSLNLKWLPKEKCSSLAQRIQNLLRVRVVNLKAIQSLVGMLNFASFCVPRGRLNHRALLKFCQSLQNAHPQHLFPLPNQGILELYWWLNNLSNRSEIHITPAAHYLTTDASGSGWGAQVDNMRLSGLWSIPETNWHSNLKEMLAILKVFQTLAPIFRNSTVSIQSDNRTTLSYLKNEGGTRSQPLLDLTCQIYRILDLHEIKLTLHHIPGRFNVEADHLSRQRFPPEWHLLPQLTWRIFAKWGVPTIDLFASKRAHVVPRYASLDITDNQAEFHDALSQTWTYPLAWVFPPPFLLPRVLAHLNNAQGLYLIVAPRWEKAFWRPDLRSRAVAPPVTIRNLASVLIDTMTSLPPPQVQDMTLEVWKCGGGVKP